MARLVDGRLFVWRPSRKAYRLVARLEDAHLSVGAAPRPYSGGWALVGVGHQATDMTET